MWARSYGGIELLRAAAYTTTTATPTPNYVDLATYASLAKREIKAVINAGTLTTTTTVTVSVLECDTTGGTYAAPTYGTTQAVITAAGLSEVNFRADKRYVKLSVEVNATGSVPLAAALVAMKREANS